MNKHSEIQHMMEQIALMFSEDYSDLIEQYDPYYENNDMFMTVEAYIRARFMNEIDPAIRFALVYAETNGAF